MKSLAERWASAWTPGEVARRLSGVGTPWYVAGGWAVDLFLGTTTRPHSDLEIGIPAGTFPAIRARLAGYAFDAAGDGVIRPDAPPETLESVYQTWVRDPATGDYVVDVFREVHDGPLWTYRRDPAVRRPYRDVVLRTPDGIPYCAPEIVLLFKARDPRPKDQADFEALLPHLTPTRRAALTTLLPPDHPWAVRARG